MVKLIIKENNRSESDWSIILYLLCIFMPNLKCHDTKYYTLCTYCLIFKKAFTGKKKTLIATLYILYTFQSQNNRTQDMAASNFTYDAHTPHRVINYSNSLYYYYLYTYI